MAAECPHVKQLQLASDKCFLNPRSWACVECGFTDSVWACLLCNHVSCGRSNSSHAIRHFEITKHPIAVEVNRRHIHCYLCDDYVLSDNSSGDIALVQSLLEQVASQQYSESCSRSGRVIRPAQSLFSRSKSRVEEASDNAADKRYTALCHWKFSQLARAFNTWRCYVAASKAQAIEGETKRMSRRRKRVLTPGMTGFRNLGNTCYMNAVLQSLSHLLLFRDRFRQLLPKAPPPNSIPLEALPPQAPPQECVKAPPPVAYSRQTTIECFQHITAPPQGLSGGCGRVTRGNSGGLNGGQGGVTRRSSKSTPKDVRNEENNLCLEMHALMRVLWSGKWAVVTPHAVLNAVWELAPAFHGYTQHDAQEFLCELLFVLQRELEAWPATPSSQPSCYYPLQLKQLLPSLFQGKLLSKVTYESCGHTSSTLESFCDLSLPFPESCHAKAPQGAAVSVPLQELLQQFTSAERLEGEEYLCTTCDTGSLQRANKQLMIAEHPQVLRIHLKRFRWSGKTQHKINQHVQFPLQLDLGPFCKSPSTATRGVAYKLSSVIVHHGMGFQSGHYTAYCWNSDAESWVHCNDARLCRSTAKDVLNCQAYILFYWLQQDQVESEEPDILDEPMYKKRRTK